MAAEAATCMGWAGRCMGWAGCDQAMGCDCMTGAAATGRGCGINCGLGACGTPLMLRLPDIRGCTGIGGGARAICGGARAIWFNTGACRTGCGGTTGRAARIWDAKIGCGGGGSICFVRASANRCAAVCPARQSAPGAAAKFARSLVRWIAPNRIISDVVASCEASSRLQAPWRAQSTSSHAPVLLTPHRSLGGCGGTTPPPPTNPHHHRLHPPRHRCDRCRWFRCRSPCRAYRLRRGKGTQTLPR